MRSDFCVFILTHGRPDSVITDTSLRTAGYTGPIYYVVDDEDATVNRYRERYGDEWVVVFDKKRMADMIDESDNFDDRRTITHARNASFEIAKALGYKYFIELDDDYLFFEFRNDGNNQYVGNGSRVRTSMDEVLEALVRYFEKIPALSIAMAQGGDFIGGSNSRTAMTGKPLRKAMNSFICSVDRPFKFLSRMNEDVNTYLTHSARGGLFLTIPLVSLTQRATQGTSGGITETYKKYGTYVKSFYSVMYAPSAVKVSMLNSTNKRIHHKIRWKNAAPMIVREEVKK